MLSHDDKKLIKSKARKIVQWQQSVNYSPLFSEMRTFLINSENFPLMKVINERSLLFANKFHLERK
jgi:hypothetical protein